MSIEGRWLPFEYDGPRTAGEVIGDLQAIARWRGTSEAHVHVKGQDGVVSRMTGLVTLDEVPDEPSAVSVLVDGMEAFVFRPEALKSAQLSTFDGADYYVLFIETDSGTVRLSDAYNGR